MKQTYEAISSEGSARLRMWRLTLPLLLAFGLSSSVFAQKIKVIVDQDARGPGTSDQQALLVFLQSDKFDVLGITTVSGDSG